MSRTGMPYGGKGTKRRQQGYGGILVEAGQSNQISRMSVEELDLKSRGVLSNQ